MGRSNFYLMLGLPFDPPEEDIEEIKRGIEKKQHEWSRGTMDFKKGPVFREYMALLPEIKRVMLNPDLRKKEAADALSYISQSIRNYMAIAEKKGYLYENEVRFIADKCQVSYTVVEKVCKVPIRKENKVSSLPTHSDKFDHYQVFLVYLEALQKRDYYDYLRENKPYDKVRQMSAKELLGLANKMDREKGKYTSTESATEKLSAECKLTFSSEEGKQAYDEYLQWKNIQAVYEQIEVATRYSKVLEKNQREEAIRLLTEATNQREKAEDLLRIYMEQEHISIEREDKTVPIIESKRMPKKEVNHKGVSAKETVSRANYLYPRVVQIREEMSKLNYEEASRLLKETIEQWGNLPELMRIEDQLSAHKTKLYAMLNKVNQEIALKKYYTANQELINLKKDFPLYQNQLIETKINNGLVSGKNLLTQARTAKQEEIIVDALMDALEVCADYPGVMELLEKYPPKLYGTITVSVDSKQHCNYIHWNDIRKDAYIRYCVMRKIDAKPYHKKDGQMLGTVDGNSFVDHSIIPGEKYFYAVYAVRCGIYSNALVARMGAVNYCEVMNPSIVSNGTNVQISWEKMPLKATVEVYRGNGYVPAHIAEGMKITTVSTNGCVDRDIEPGNLYGYRVYTVYMINGEKHYSTGIALRVNAGMKGYESVSNLFTKDERVRINYYFEVKKLFSYPYQVILHVEPESYIRSLPPLVIVGSVNYAPLYKASGKVIAMLPSKEIEKDWTYTIKVKDLGDMKYLNLFLQREEDVKKVMLLLKEGETLNI